MTSMLRPNSVHNFGVFAVDERSALREFFIEHGFAVLRGLWNEATLTDIETDCTTAQSNLTTGKLDEKYGTRILIDVANTDATTAFANYVTRVTELSVHIRNAALDPYIASLMHDWLSPDAYLLESYRFGVVYQDARPGRESSYARIGWHSDWQSGPNKEMWPSVAFTIHLDATSPANGFLRVVPGSHRWATPAPYRNVNNAVVPSGSKAWGGHTDEPPPFDMPLGFGKVPGELAIYCERGDVLFHDAYLWHSAARATDDEGVRRHLRGGWYSGVPITDENLDDFVKNAAR
jgi:ectoine hydroxylase-related dioxygenase (phytanoyl-CoA dioxygenase family)